MPFLSHGYSDLKELNFKEFFWRLYTKGFDEEDLLSNAAQVAYFFSVRPVSVAAFSGKHFRHRAWFRQRFKNRDVSVSQTGNAGFRLRIGAEDHRRSNGKQHRR